MEGWDEHWRLYNNEKVIPNFKIIYYNEKSFQPRVISIKAIQLLRVLILSRVCFVSLSIRADVYRAQAIFQIWWEVKTRLVAFQRHKVALDIWDMDEVLRRCSAATSLALVPLRLRIVINSIKNILLYISLRARDSSGTLNECWNKVEHSKWWWNFTFYVSLFSE